MEPKPMVGVVALKSEATLKRQVLLFDRLAIPELPNVVAMVTSLRQAIDRLHDADIVFEPSRAISPEWASDEEVQASLRHLREVETRIEELEASRIAASGVEPSAEQGRLEQVTNSIVNRVTRSGLLRELQPSRLRLCAITLRHAGNDAVPVLDDYAELAPAVGRSERAELVHLVLENLPMPSEATPWEDIIAFKKEKRLQQLHLELRQWLIQRSRMEVDPIDTDIELKAMVQRYETYMQSVRTTKTTGVVELVVKVLGGLVLGWQNSFAAVGQIAVSAKKREAEIMEAEMKAPGAELAFIAQAQERFGK